MHVSLDYGHSEAGSNADGDESRWICFRHNRAVLTKEAYQESERSKTARGMIGFTDGSNQESLRNSAAAASLLVRRLNR